MNLLLIIIFFVQFLGLIFLIVSRKPARLPGFEKTMNQTLDRIIFLLLTSFLLTLLSFKCH
jgi:hypothetical protein